MTEEEARAWLRSNQNVSRETWDKLELFIALLLDEMSRQNLISKSSADHIWTRHIVDSAQLLHFAPEKNGVWLDLGTGAGFPGIVAAILSGHELVHGRIPHTPCGFPEFRYSKTGFGCKCPGPGQPIGDNRRLSGRYYQCQSLCAAGTAYRAFAPVFHRKDGLALTKRQKCGKGAKGLTAKTAKNVPRGT